MLNIQNVSKIYIANNKKALEQVSFKIERGEFVALLGQNGAGKSTLINILSGNVKKTEGQITINGYDLDTRELQTKRILGIVPQEISFDNFFSVAEVLKNQSGYFGIRNNTKMIDYLLSVLSLQDKKHTNTKQLSGGMKRRLLIAKALVHQPELLILDEPTAGVDIELRRSMHDFLRELNKTGTTIILTTHYLEEAEKLCDRIIILDHGKKVMDAPKETVMRSMDNRITIEFYLQNELAKDRFMFLQNFSPVIQQNNKLQLQASAHDISGILKNMAEQNITYSDIRFENKKLEDMFMHIVKN